MSSVAFDKIVPFGQNFVLDDMPVTLTLKERVAFFLCLINVSVDSRKCSESRLGSCLGSHIASLLDGVEDGSTPYSGNLREEHVLYGIPLGAVRRIVGNPNVETQSFGCFHEAPLELPASGIVGTSSVTKDTDTLCTWIYIPEVFLPLFHQTIAGKLRSIVTHSKGHIAGIPHDIVDAVRHHLAVGERGIVMVVHLDGFSAVGCSVVTSERAKDFLFLRVHAEYGMLGERTLPSTSLFADSALFEVLSCLKLMTTSVDGITGHIKGIADKVDTMPAKPFCYDSDELSRLSLVCVSEVLHFFIRYYICWIIRNLHNYLEFSYKGTDFQQI